MRAGASPLTRIALAILVATFALVPGAAEGSDAPGTDLTAEMFTDQASSEQESTTSAGETSASPAVIDSTATPKIPANAPGTITGYVRDAESGSGLPYTNVVIYRERERGAPVQETGSIALTGGQYFARVAPGSYEVRFLYLGYETFVAPGIVVEPGTTVVVDGDMKVKPIEFQPIAVQATKITNTAVAQLVEKKRATVVQEAITAEEISKSTDSDAAEALQRVTGVSVVGGKYVFVRGLGDRYSSTTLNGAPLSSPEPGRNTVPLDLFPAALLDNLVIQKTYSPDMDGNFGGGNIDIRTRRSIDRREFRQRVSMGFTESVLENDFYTYDGGRTDLLALDDGTRELPRLVRETGPGENFTRATVEEQRAATFAFPNVWTPKRVEGPPNFGYSGLYTDNFSVGGRQGSYLLTATYSHSVKTEIDAARYQAQGGDEVAEPRQETPISRGSERSVLWGINGEVTLRTTDASRVRYNLFYSRSAEDEARTRIGTTFSEDDQYLSHSLKFVQRDLMTHVLQGQHDVGAKGSRFRWLLSNSNATREVPDERYSRFNWAGRIETLPSGERVRVGGWGQANTSSALQRRFSDTAEDSWVLRLDYDFELEDLSWLQRRVKLGYAYRTADRGESVRVFTTAKPSAQVYQANQAGRPEDLFDLDNFVLSPPPISQWTTEEVTGNFDFFDANIESNALYGMIDLDFFDTFVVSTGARLETSVQSAESLSPQGEEAGIPRIETVEERQDWLPTMNLTWRVTDAMNLRGGYSRTLNRPQLRELSPLNVTDYELDETRRGNPFLRTATVDAVDLRWEIYPAPGSYAAVSYYDKTIDGAIQETEQSFTNASRIVPVNGEDGGKLTGWEFEWRGPMVDAVTAGHQTALTTGWLATRPLWLLGQIPGLGSLTSWTPRHRLVGRTDLPQLSQFGFAFNYTISESEIVTDLLRVDAEISPILDVDGDPDPSRSTSPLERQVNRLTGQTDSSFNLGLFWDNGKQDAALLFKDFGPRQLTAGVRTGDDPDMVVDAAFSTRLGANVKLKLSVEDLFPSDDVIEYYDVEFLLTSGEVSNVQRIIPTAGRRYGASLSYDF